MVKTYRMNSTEVNYVYSIDLAFYGENAFNERRNMENITRMKLRSKENTEQQTLCKP